MAAFVLGNGKSRAPIDIDSLFHLGAVYGCNALYRTHTPTVLVATDREISAKIQESGYSQENRFHTRRPISGSGAQPLIKKYHGYSSGPNAVALAAQDGHNPVYLLGFDMGPSETGRFNNVYADSEFYKTNRDTPTFAGNWIRQLITVFQDFRHTKFYRVHGSTTAIIQEFDVVPNMEKMDFTAFVALINTPKDL